MADWACKNFQAIKHYQCLIKKPLMLFVDFCFSFFFFWLFILHFQTRISLSSPLASIFLWFMINCAMPAVLVLLLSVIVKVVFVHSNHA